MFVCVCVCVCVCVQEKTQCMLLCMFWRSRLACLLRGERIHNDWENLGHLREFLSGFFSGNTVWNTLDM